MQQVSSTTAANSSAFATLQNNLNSNLDSNVNSNSNSNLNLNLRSHKEYICGLKYRFSDCYYIVEQKRP